MDISSLIGPSDQTELRAITAMTLFGSFTRGGTSGSLGNDNDTALLLGLRKWADCVLVGAETVRAEEYGYSPTPTAVITASLDLDASSPLFDGTVLILTPESSLHDDTLSSQREQLTAAGARLVSTGGGTPQEIVDAVREAGYRRISCEGGPGVYAAMLQADLVDVLHITVDPSVSSSDGAAGLDFDGAHDFTRRFVLESAEHDGDSMLFCRYRRARH